MYRSTSSRRAAVVLALLLWGCGSDVTGPGFSGPPVPVALKFCAGSEPAWVGFQNGNGPWVAVSRDAGSVATYTFTVNGGGALAYVLPVGGDAQSYGYETEVVYASAEELQKYVIGACYQQPITGAKTIRGTVAGLGTNELGQVYLGSSSAGIISNNGSDANYTLRRVADASQDLIAVRRTTLSTAGDIARMVVRRGINPGDGSTLQSIDFNSAEALQPVNATLTISGSELGGLMQITSAYATAGGSSVLFTGTQTTALSIPFMGVGANNNSGDLHILAAATQDSYTEARAAETYFRFASSRTLEFGPTLAPFTVAAVTGIPNVRLKMDIPSQPAYGTAAVADISAGGFGSFNRSFEIVVTAAYLGGTPTTWSLVMPDFTGVAGYDPNYGMTTALGLDYYGIATGGNRQFFVPAQDGQSFVYALREGAAVANVKSLHALPSLESEASTPRSALRVDRPWSRRRP